MSQKTGEKIDFTNLSDLLGYQIRQAQTASFRDLAVRFREISVTPGEFSLMTILRDNPQIRQIDLLRIYKLDKSTMSVAVNRLVRRGLVVQKQLPEDRRFHGLSLTREGEEILRTATEIVNDQERRMADALGGEDWDMTMGALRRIVAALKPD
jgi:DNA-binding MarR family transcriptional regulator